MLNEYPPDRVFTLIDPGPVLLVATAEGRKKNIMTITWSMAMKPCRMSTGESFANAMWSTF